MKLTTNTTLRLAAAFAFVLAVAALLVSPAQGAGGCADPGLGGRLGYKAVCGTAAPFYTERSRGQNDPGLGSMYGYKVVTGRIGPARFVTEHSAGQFEPKPVVQRPVARIAPSDGFDWKDAAIGAGGTFALLLLVAGMAVRRSRTRLASS